MELLKHIALTILFLAFSPQAWANSYQTDKVDRFIANEMQKRRIPGLALAVIRNNRVIKVKGYGAANLEHNVPVTPHTVFPIASMDKQITATAIMMLVETNKLSLDDRIDKFFESSPDIWKTIKVRHLLTHTAGLKDEVAEEVDGRLFAEYTNEQLLAYVSKLSLDFPAGEKWQYSDAGFFLLQMIVEKISGLPYQKFFDERIAKPLGMTDTVYFHPRDVIKNRATSYYINEENRYRASQWRMIDFDAYGDIGSTVLDFAKWDAAMNTGKLLKKSSLDLMWTKTRLNDGSVVANHIQNNTLFYSSNSYGFGWALSGFRGHRIIAHDGFTGTSIFRLPEDKLTVIVFTNLNLSSNSSPQLLARTIAGMYVPTISWSSLKEKPDADSQFTLKLKEEITHLGRGQPGINLYTPSFGLTLKDKLKDLQCATKKLGLLKSLVFLDAETSVAKRQLYYRANYENGQLFFIISLNREGLIELVEIERG